MTWGDLDRRARAIGSTLQGRVAAGSRVVLMYPAGFEFLAGLFGCLYGGCIPVPAVPPRTRRHSARIHLIVEDSAAEMILTSAEALGTFESVPRAGAALLNTDQITGDLGNWRPPDITRDSIAMVQYTSGSTSDPKGVLVTHAQLLHNQFLIRESFSVDDGGTVVGWLPLFHDMGLIGNVFQSLYCGHRCVLFSPSTFLRSPVRWLEAISTYGASISGGPDFAYDYCARQISAVQKESLDLSHWQVAFSGSEPVRADTIRRFIDAFQPCGFRPEAFLPCYGLAEATLFVCGAKRHDAPRVIRADAAKLRQNRIEFAGQGDDARELVICGKSPASQSIVIADPVTKTRLPEGQVGEIWVSGPSVAHGYWQRAAETARVFQACLAESGTAHFLRTGDLGALIDNELVVAGRSKDLIIIRGNNYHPQDIELAAQQSHEALGVGGCATFSAEIGGREQLVIVQEVTRAWVRRPPGDVLDAIREAVFRSQGVQPYDLVLVRPFSIPRTSSGKIRRGACRDAYLNGGLSEIVRSTTASQMSESSAAPEAPASAASPDLTLVESLGKLVTDAARLPDLRLNPDEDLSMLGLDSLASVEFANRVEREWSVRLPTAVLLSGITLRGLAALILDRGEAARCAETEGVPAPASRAPSEGQKSLWYLNRLVPGNPAYHVPVVVRLHPDTNLDALERSLHWVVARHGSLRTVFGEVDGEPVRRVLVDSGFRLEKLDAHSWSDAVLRAAIVKEVQRPFDLSKGPIIRSTLFVGHPTGSVLVVTAHHIAADLWSLGLVLGELGQRYTSEVTGAADPLGEPPDYEEFVNWQYRTLRGAVGQSQWDYWNRKLEGANRVLELPADFTSTREFGWKGASCRFEIDRETTVRLERLARSSRSTLHRVLLAAYSLLLGKHSGQRDVLVGCPFAGRSHAGFERLVGYCVNTLPMRVTLNGDPSFREFLGQVGATVQEALDNQDLALSYIVEKLSPERDRGRSPLFQTMFSFQGNPGGETAAELLAGSGREVEVGRLKLTSMALDFGVAAFDLAVTAIPVADRVAGTLQYDTRLFAPDTAARMVSQYLALLSALAADPDRPISEIAFLPDADRRHLDLWNSTGVEYAAPALLHTLFADQVRRSPGRQALRFQDERLSYSELDACANRLAQYLRRMGVGPEVRVGVMLERSTDLVVALLGVLKAGGAYVPLDPGYPKQRLEYIARDSAVSVLVTDSRLRPALPEFGGSLVLVDADAAAIERMPACEPDSGVLPDNIAYVIYTSGSTGAPKGAMNTHRGVANRILWMQEQFGLDPSDRILQKTPFSFDVSVWEFFWPLAAGAELVVAPPGAHKDNRALAALVRDCAITTIHFVPSMLDAFLGTPGCEEAASLRRVICSGEELPAVQVERFFEKFHCGLWNLYGPTEASIDVTYWECVPGASLRRVPIGGPIANTQIRILDEAGKSLPIGLAGELHIGGTGLARGYWNRPGLTAERFVPDPLSSQPGARLYRTGDLARWRSDGAVEFLGRLDHQVKIRGFRVEPGEIETRLLEADGVRQCLVVVRENTPGDRKLAAYVVANGAGRPDAAELRKHLSERLPEYMIPTTFVFLDAMPLSPNGKADRHALPKPDVVRLEPAGGSGAPLDELEMRLAGLWSEVLRVERVGLDDNFFDLGGHSLLLARLQSRVQRVLEVDVAVLDLLKCPTVRAQAEHLRNIEAGAAAAEPLRTRAGIRMERQSRLKDSGRKPSVFVAVQP